MQSLLNAAQKLGQAEGRELLSSVDSKILTTIIGGGILTNQMKAAIYDSQLLVHDAILSGYRLAAADELVHRTRTIPRRK